MSKKEREPFGEEWKKEMRKFTKDGLIDMLKDSFMDRVANGNSLKEEAEKYLLFGEMKTKPCNHPDYVMCKHWKNQKNGCLGCTKQFTVR